MFRLRDENFPCVCIDFKLSQTTCCTHTHTPVLPHQWKPLRSKAGTRKTTHPEVCMCGGKCCFSFWSVSYDRFEVFRSTYWHIICISLLIAIFCYWLKCLHIKSKPRLLNYPAGPMLVIKNTGSAYSQIANDIARRTFKVIDIHIIIIIRNSSLFCWFYYHT